VAGLRLTGMKTLSAEQVLALNPDVIVTGGKVRNTTAQLPPLFLHPALQVVDAVQQQRVFVLPRRLLSTLSQHIVEGVEAMARVLHPQMASLQVVP
jgi:iron complex transport system substrate-binding protein